MALWRILTLMLFQILITYGLNLTEYSESFLGVVSNVPTSKYHHQLSTVSDNLLFNKKEINLILQKFDEIIYDIPRFERNHPYSKLRTFRSLIDRPKCTISKEKLITLKNEIENIFMNVSSSEQSKCTLNLNDTDNCNELTKVIQCGIQHLKIGFLEAITSSKNDSIMEITKWQNTYEKLRSEYQKQNDNFNQSISQEFQFKLNQLQISLQNLAKTLNEALHRLETTTVDLCILTITNGNIDKAVEHSKYLNLNLMLQIVRQSYNYTQNGINELNSFENVMNFIKRQSAIDKKLVYEILYNEMVEYFSLAYFTLRDEHLLENIKIRMCILEILLGKVVLSVKHFRDLNFNLRHKLIKNVYNYDEDVTNKNVMEFIDKYSKESRERTVFYETLYQEILSQPASKDNIKLNLCVLAINLGKIDDAVKHYKQLNSISISEIVSKVYECCEKSPKVFSLASFINKESETCNKLIGFTTLLKHVTLKEMWDLQIYYFRTNTLFGNSLRDLYLNMHLYNNCLNETQSFTADMLYYSLYYGCLDGAYRIDKGLVFIPNNNNYFDTFIQPSLPLIFTKMDLPNYLVHCLLNNFNKNFKQNLSILLILFDKLQKQELFNNDEQIVTFAFHLKKYTETYNNHLDEKTKQMIDNMRSIIPNSIQNLIWEGSVFCKLKNSYNGGYLYAHDVYKFDNKFRKVFSSESILQSYIKQEESQWVFIFNGQHFLIKNFNWNEWLDTPLDSSYIPFLRRPVITDEWRRGWIIKPSNNGSRITIQNQEDEYLYVDSTDKWSKLGFRVFTSKEMNLSDKRVKEREWELVCK